MTPVDDISTLFVNRRLEESISDFFSKAGACTTRIQCDAFANKTFGGPVEPVPFQGVYSYTVAAANGSVIVQFRELDSPLDTQMLVTIQNIHPDFVASCSFHGTIGLSPALLIYAMNMLPGDNYFKLSLLNQDLDHRLATVRSLARFFAQSWKNSSPSDPSTMSELLEDCYSSFGYISSNLPTRFQETISQVQGVLPTLFSGGYPLVITHGDLSEMNILANPRTGEITGIIDWAEAGIQPFGFALYALDNILGYLTPNGWGFHDTAEDLQDEFWRVFYKLVGGVSGSEMELMRHARLAGLFLRYGIPHRSGRKGVVGVGGAMNTSIYVLDALIPAFKTAHVTTQEGHAESK
ncbi:hypothetical protein F4818DRAFT_419144 [Hypoxylon cercidicola]|nr:hypothetical protein F4818DRAFT_419144 [Hypoxylon cercidicola]